MPPNLKERGGKHEACFVFDEIIYFDCTALRLDTKWGKNGTMESGLATIL
jgi:hypothetical protein